MNADRSPEDASLADVIDGLGNPVALSRDNLLREAETLGNGLAEFLREGKNARKLSHRLEKMGYLSIESDAYRGFWTINKKRQVVWGHKSLTLTDRKRAATVLADAGGAIDDLAKWAAANCLTVPDTRAGMVP